MKKIYCNKLECSDEEIVELIKMIIFKIIVAIILFFVIFYKIINVRIVSGIQMQPELHDGDLIISFMMVNDFNINDLILYYENDNAYFAKIIGSKEQKITKKDTNNISVDEEIINCKYIDHTEMIFPNYVEDDEVLILSEDKNINNEFKKIKKIKLKDIKGKIIGIVRSREF